MASSSVASFFLDGLNTSSTVGAHGPSYVASIIWSELHVGLAYVASITWSKLRSKYYMARVTK